MKSVIAPYRVLWLIFVVTVLSLSCWFLFSTDAQRLYAEENEPEAPGSISGVIRNVEGTPLPDIDVYLYQATYANYNWSSVRQMKTDASGRYRFSVLPSGVYRVGINDASAIYATTFYPNAHTVYQATDIVVNGDQRAGFDLNVEASGEIAGMILATEAITLTNKVVDLYRPSDFPQYWGDGWSSWQQINSQYLSSEQTQFHFGGLAAGSYRICAGGYDSTTQWRECYDDVYDLNLAQDVTVTAGAVVSDVVIVLGDGADYGMIQGQVTSPQNVPLADVGVYLIRADTVSYLPTLIFPTAASLEQAQQPDATTSTYPTYLPYNYYTTTDMSGTYRLPNLAAGDYQLLFFDGQGRYRYEYYDNTLTRTASTSVSIGKRDVITGIDAQLTAGAHIKGTITLLGQSAPPTSITVYKKTNGLWEYIATTSSDPVTGNYDVGALPAGSYRLDATSWINSPFIYYNYHTFYGGDSLETATDITVSEAGTQENININFNSGPQFNGAMSGRVTADGKPLADARVSLYSIIYVNCCSQLQLGPVQTYALTDNDGRFKIEGLTNQSFYVRFDDATGARASLFYPSEPRLLPGSTVSTNDSETTTGVDIDLPLGGKIKGQVRQLDGSDVSMLTLLAISVEDSQQLFIFREIPVSADGSYLLAGLASGTYQVCAAIKYYDNYMGLDCYGGAGFFQGFGSGIPLTVKAGQTIDEIDILWGRDYERYLPVIAR